MSCKPTVEEVDVGHDLRSLDAGECAQTVLREFLLLREAANTDGDLDGPIPTSAYLWRLVCCERSPSNPQRACYRILYRRQNDDEGNGDCFHICRVFSPDDWDEFLENYLESLTDEELERLLDDAMGGP